MSTLIYKLTPLQPLHKFPSTYFYRKSINMQCKNFFTTSRKSTQNNTFATSKKRHYLYRDFTSTNRCIFPLSIKTITKEIKKWQSNKNPDSAHQTFVPMKTSPRRLSPSHTEDASIKTNTFALAIRPQKTPSRRLGQDQYIRLGYTPPRRFQDVFKTF